MIGTGGGRLMAERTGGVSSDGKHSTAGSVVNDEPEEVVFKVFYFTPTDSNMLGKPTKEEYKVFQEYLLLYYLVDNAAFKNDVEVHQKVVVEDLKESIYLVLTQPP